MKRWPLVRHVRYWWLRMQVNRHYAMWQTLGYLPIHAQHDYDQLDRIWRGER